MTEPAPTSILLVDDEPSLREPLAEYLSRQGFVVREADSAAQARAASAAPAACGGHILGSEGVGLKPQHIAHRTGMVTSRARVGQSGTPKACVVFCVWWWCS